MPLQASNLYSPKRPPTTAASSGKQQLLLPSPCKPNKQRFEPSQQTTTQPATEAAATCNSHQLPPTIQHRFCHLTSTIVTVVEHHQQQGRVTEPPPIISSLLKLAPYTNFAAAVAATGVATKHQTIEQLLQTSSGTNTVEPATVAVVGRSVNHHHQSKPTGTSSTANQQQPEPENQRNSCCNLSPTAYNNQDSSSFSLREPPALNQQAPPSKPLL